MKPKLDTLKAADWRELADQLAAHGVTPSELEDLGIAALAATNDPVSPADERRELENTVLMRLSKTVPVAELELKDAELTVHFILHDPVTRLVVGAISQKLRGPAELKRYAGHLIAQTKAIVRP